MTGIYLRVQRGAKFHNLDITEMTAEEIDRAMSNRTAEELTRWVVALAGWIRDNVQADQSESADSKESGT